MFEGAHSSAENNGDFYDAGYGFAEFDVEPLLGAFVIDAGEEDFSDSEFDGFLHPFDNVAVGVFAAIIGEGGPLAGAGGFGFYAEHHALATESFADFADQFGVAGCGGVDGDFIGPGVEEEGGIFDGSDSSADGERNEDVFGGFAEEVFEGVAVIEAGDDIHVTDFVDALGVIVFDKCLRVSEFSETFETDSLDEIWAFNVEAGNYTDVTHSVLGVVCRKGLVCEDSVAELPDPVFFFPKMG